MTEPKRIGGIEVDENLAHEHRSWIFERAGWGVLGALIVLALLGVFGKGILSKASAATPDQRVSAAYERFARLEAPVRIRFRLRPETDGSSTQARLWLSADYLRTLRVEQFEPEPDTQQAVQGGILYTFPSSGTEDTVEVTLYAVAEAMGKHSARIGPSPQNTVAFWQFVYP